MPTLTAEYETPWNDSTTPKTQSVTVVTGDVLAVVGISEDAGTTIATPTGGGLTYTLQQSVTVASNSAVYVWTVEITAPQTFTLSASEGGSGTAWWGYNCLVFPSSTVGASSKTNSTGGPSLSLTTTAANSSIVVFDGDWNAVDGTTRTARSIGSGSFVELSYFRDASHYGVYGGYYTDSGAAGAKTVGWSAPTGQKYAVIALEVKPTGGPAATSAPIIRRSPGALLQM